jgi:hypothetical protein
MSAASDAAERARLRAASAADRLRELAVRRDELCAGVARASSESVARASRALAAAQEHAARALISARDGYVRAALAHDRAADRHADEAARGQGGVAAHRARAADHRRWADADRRRAVELPLPKELTAEGEPAPGR